MRIRTLVSFSVILLATSAFAQKKASIEGNVADIDGKPLKSPQVRIQQENSGNAAILLTTDAKGHFVATDLPAGSFHVEVLQGGKVKFSEAHIKTARGRVAHVNLGGKQVASKATQPKKRARWIPPQVGSRLTGHYEDEPARGPNGQGADLLGSEDLQRFQNKPGPPPPANGGR
jgi:hypothetical protein